MALFFLAVAAGFLTILAPCILPVLPILLGTSGGRSKRRPLVIVAGFVAAFAVIGAALATAGTFLGISHDALRAVAGVVLLLFGAALLFEEAWAKIAAKIEPALTGLGLRLSGGAARKTDAASGLLVGLSLGLVWAPCAGPILGTILTLAANTKDFLTTLLLMFAYAFGAGIPMLGIAYGSHRVQERLKAAGSAWKTLNRALGILVILASLAILTGYDGVAVAWLLTYLPAPSTVLGL